MMTTIIVGTACALAGLLVGHYVWKAADAVRFADEVGASTRRTREVTGEDLLALDRHTKARQERLRQTLPRPPETTLDPFGPRRKS